MPEGALYIHIIPHRRAGAAAGRGCWSVSDRFPIELTSHGPLTNPVNEFDEPEWLIDFETLYHRKYGLGHPTWPVWKCSVDFDDPNFMKTFVEEDAMSLFGKLGLMDVDFNPKPALAEWDRAFARPLRGN